MWPEPEPLNPNSKFLEDGVLSFKLGADVYTHRPSGASGGCVSGEPVLREMVVYYS